jgi:hypothetical protein
LFFISCADIIMAAIEKSKRKAKGRIQTLDDIILAWGCGQHHSRPNFSSKDERRQAVLLRQKTILGLVHCGDLARLIRFPEWRLSRVARSGLPIISPIGSSHFHRYQNRMARLISSLNHAVWSFIAPPNKKSRPQSIRKKKTPRVKKSTRNHKITQRAIATQSKTRYAKPGHPLQVVDGRLRIGRERSKAHISQGTILEIPKISRKLAKLIGCSADQRHTMDRTVTFMREKSNFGVSFSNEKFVPLSELPQFTVLVVVRTPVTELAKPFALKQHLRSYACR